MIKTRSLNEIVHVCAATIVVVLLPVFFSRFLRFSLSTFTLFSLGLVFVLIGYLYLRKSPKFYRVFHFYFTLVHECIHAVAGLFNGQTVSEIKVETFSGKCILEGTGSLPAFVLLAPYHFPVGLYCLLIVYFFYPNVLLLILIGANAGLFSLRLFSEIHHRQTDLQKVGLRFAMWWIIVYNILNINFLVFVIFI